MVEITVITCGYNEEKMLPFFLKHYSFADLIVFFDNHSTDRSADIVRNFTEAKTMVLPVMETDEFDNTVKNNIYSQAYKLLPGDWFIIVDCDEFIYHDTGNVRAVIQHANDLDRSVLKTTGYNMIGELETEFDYSNPITELVKQGVEDNIYSKMVVFKKSVNISFLPGQHRTRIHSEAFIDDFGLKLLHYKYFSGGHGIERGRINTLRRSQLDKDCSLGSVNPENYYVDLYNVLYKRREPVL